MSTDFTIRRLISGDEALLFDIAEHDGGFDVVGSNEKKVSLSTSAAKTFLADPAVLFWCAFNNDEIIGFLFCHILAMRGDEERELLLYEIGTRHDWRRKGVGRALITEMETWMHANNVPEVWLGADNAGAQAFYEACGFVADPTRPVYMTRRI